MPKTKSWDYLVITAANPQQARSYEVQLRQRERTAELQTVGSWLVVPDIDGKRIGSGGSTLHCLAQIVERECGGVEVLTFDKAEAVLRGLRILIVHAGGDSRRLPAYSHCGKMFVPLPTEDPTATATTLFDRLIPIFLGLPERRGGQVVVASGDALILFDPDSVDLSHPGITALGSYASPTEAAHHGVFCVKGDGFLTNVPVRRYLQKPAIELQASLGTTNSRGESVLDVGVMSLDATAAVQLMKTFLTENSATDDRSRVTWGTQARETLLSHGLDLYLEICCALGTDTNLEQYTNSLRTSGSKIDGATLATWFQSLRSIPLNLHVLSHCEFLHFGTTRQLITSGNALLAKEPGRVACGTLVLNSHVHSAITAEHSWIEGCSVNEALTLQGFNAVVGADILEPLSLSTGACLDVSPGLSRNGEEVWFLRYYGIDDSFKPSAGTGGTFCGVRLELWLSVMGIDAKQVWSDEIPDNERSLWNARVFPAEGEHQSFLDWIWLFHIESATSEQKDLYRAADRYSCSEIAVRVDQCRFYARRSALRSLVLAHGHAEPGPAFTVQC